MCLINYYCLNYFVINLHKYINGKIMLRSGAVHKIHNHTFGIIFLLHHCLTVGNGKHNIIKK